MEKQQKSEASWAGNASKRLYNGGGKSLKTKNPKKWGPLGPGGAFLGLVLDFEKFCPITEPPLPRLPYPNNRTGG